MKLKKDWSLAYFLYYFCWIGYWMVGFSFVLQIITTGLINSDGYTRIIDVPVSLQVEHLDSQKHIEAENISIRIPQTVQTRINITAHTAQNWWEIIALFAIKFFNGFVIFASLFFLSRVFKNVAENDPFHSKNSAHLFTIGWIFIAAGLFGILMIFLPIPLLDVATAQSSIIINNLNLKGDTYLLLGVLTIVISYVFKEGARIHEEQKLTV